MNAHRRARGRRAASRRIAAVRTRRRGQGERARGEHVDGGELGRRAASATGEQPTRTRGPGGGVTPLMYHPRARVWGATNVSIQGPGHRNGAPHASRRLPRRHSRDATSLAASMAPGASPNLYHRTEFTNTPETCACILREGWCAGTPKTCDTFGRGAFNSFTTVLAIRRGHLDCLKYAIENGCEWHRTALHMRMWSQGHYGCVTYAMESQVCVDDDVSRIDSPVLARSE